MLVGKEVVTIIPKYQCIGQMNIFDFLEDNNIKNDADKMIEEVLLRGTGFVGGKQRVCNFYLQSELTSAKRANLIKKEYGTGGAGWPLDGYGVHGYDTYKGDGITIYFRDESGEHKKVVSWNKVEKWIGKFISEGKYNKRPIPHYPKMNSKKLAKCPKCGTRIPEFSKPSVCEECFQELDWRFWGINYLTSETTNNDKTCKNCIYANWNERKCLCEIDCIQYSEFQSKPLKRNCAATLKECNHENCKKVAVECLDIDCKAECCQACTKLCGARCNYSSHQPKVFDKDNNEWIENTK